MTANRVANANFEPPSPHRRFPFRVRKQTTTITKTLTPMETFLVSSQSNFVKTFQRSSQRWVLARCTPCPCLLARGRSAQGLACAPREAGPRCPSRRAAACLALRPARKPPRPARERGGSLWGRARAGLFPTPGPGRPRPRGGRPGREPRRHAVEERRRCRRLSRRSPAAAAAAAARSHPAPRAAVAVRGRPGAGSAPQAKGRVPPRHP